MALEQRGGHLYYYRSVRRGTRVTKEYVGGGLAAMLAADLDAEEREQRTALRQRIEAERQAWAALEDQTREVEQVSDVLLKAVLQELGFHQHDRGEWRRRRV